MWFLKPEHHKNFGLTTDIQFLEDLGRKFIYAGYYNFSCSRSFALKVRYLLLKSKEIRGVGAKGSKLTSGESFYYITA